jgi:hypothetical protein
MQTTLFMYNLLQAQIYLIHVCVCVCVCVCMCARAIHAFVLLHKGEKPSNMPYHASTIEPLQYNKFLYNTIWKGRTKLATYTHGRTYAHTLST